jgi:hypothetical protein
MFQYCHCHISISHIRKSVIYLQRSVMANNLTVLSVVPHWQVVLVTYCWTEWLKESQNQVRLQCHFVLTYVHENRSINFWGGQMDLPNRILEMETAHLETWGHLFQLYVQMSRELRPWPCKIRANAQLPCSYLALTRGRMPIIWFGSTRFFLRCNNTAMCMGD